jgi:Winged helix DNA-binding domain
VRRIGVAERRARLGQRHRLAAAARADDPFEVARSLVALHATDPSSVFLAAWARMAEGDVVAVERALYERRVLLRILGMRRTVFVTPRDTAPVVHAACTQIIAARERRKLISWLAEAGIADDSGAWLRDVEEAALRALAARGEATAAELAADDPRLRAQIVLSRGKPYEGRQSVCSRVLFLLAADGRVVRGRPVGSWTSSQYRWSTLETWCPDGVTEWRAEDAEAELARRWLTAFGPATAEDLRWWAGWSVAQVKRAFARIRPVEVDLGGAVGVVLPDDLEPVPAAEPWAALLPALDPTPMGWSRREWFLGEHGAALFDRNGNVGPTVWWDGRIIGGWAHRTVKGQGEAGGEIVWRLLEDVGTDATAAVEAAADRLAARLGPVRITPRARGATLLEQQLARLAALGPTHRTANAEHTDYGLTPAGRVRPTGRMRPHESTQRHA